MYRVTPNRALAFMIFGVIAFSALLVISDPIILQEIFNHLSLGVTLLVAVTWGGPAYKAIWEDRDKNAGEWMVVVAIFLSALTLSMNRLIAIVSYYLDRPAWLLDGAITAFIPYSITVTYSLLLIAPGMVPASGRTHLVHLGLAGLIGGLAAGFMLGKSI